MAVVLNGAVILKQNGTSVVYAKKCEKCGAVRPATTTTTISSSPNVKYNSSFRCPKCGNTQKIVIVGG